MSIKKQIIGLTGSIGSGKSTAANYLKTLGAYLVDADIVAREVVIPNRPAHTAIKQLIGNHYLNPDQTLNRAKIKTLIFNSPEIKKSYESIIIPFIRKEILAMIQNPPNDCSYVLLVAPLLFEKGLAQFVNRSIAIDIDEKQQISRVYSRDKQKDKELIKKIIRSQMNRLQRNLLADYVISNCGTVDDLKQQLDNIHQIIINQEKPDEPI